jgi:DNA replication protein DnaC
VERLGDSITRLRLRELQRKAPPQAPEEPVPECAVCKDHGFVRKDVPLDHPDFGRAFPCVCRQADVKDRLRRRSNLGSLSNRTLATFHPEGRDLLGEVARERLRAALEVSTAYAEAPLAWLVLCGPSGCGKTHLAAAIANRQIELGNDAFFTVVPDLLDHLRATYTPSSDVTYDELFESVRNTPLLVLDDLGTQNASGWAQEKLFQILNHRFNAELPTVITTNHRLSELDERLRARLEDRQVARVVYVQEWESPILESLLGDWPSGLRQQTFETFRADMPGLEEAQIESLEEAYKDASKFAHAPSGWLLLVGDVGRGKTHLAAAIKNFRDSLGEPSLFMTVPDLLDYLRATYAPSSDVTYDRGFEVIRSAPVLILDDYGAHSSTQWAEEKLFQLLNSRFNARLPTVITSNVPFDRPDVLEASQQQELRIFSRLLDRDLSRVVRIDAPAFGRRLPTMRQREPLQRRMARPPGPTAGR